MSDLEKIYDACRKGDANSVWLYVNTNNVNEYFVYFLVYIVTILERLGMI